MSSFSNRILEDLKSAMKAKDTTALSVLRGLKSAIKYAAIEQGGADAELDDAASVAIVRKELKKRQDSVESFRKGNRPELAEQEEAEAAVLATYLPAEMPDDKVAALVDEVITELGASSRKDMGGVMKLLQEKTSGGVDNKKLSKMVMDKLS
jgi:hypothetical protein